MVTQRDGSEIDLLNSSIRTVGGALFSTTVYALTGIVYAAVTSPAITGRYFFLAITIQLVLRPIKGLGQTLQKIGSERGESVSAYLGLTVIFAAVYLTLFLAALSNASVQRLLTRVTVFDESLFLALALLAISTGGLIIAQSLVAAIGYPSAGTWITAIKATLQMGILLGLASQVTTTADLIFLIVAVKLVIATTVILAINTAPVLPDQRELERAWGFAKWSIPDQILDRFSYNMPVYVLGIVATPAAVGIYETADRFADFGATISWRLASPLLTKVSGDTSLGKSSLEYLDAAITGGTGATFVVLGYLIAGHDIIANIAFEGAGVEAFSATALLVGIINILRGFWTLTSHAMEGAGYPSVSFRTKLYGLICSVPITAGLGAQYGALAGAVGYGIMNLVIFVYVIYYARSVLGAVPVDMTLIIKLIGGTVVSAFVTWATMEIAAETGASPVGVAIIAALTTLVAFAALLGAISPETRTVIRRAYNIYIGRYRNIVQNQF